MAILNQKECDLIQQVAATLGSHNHSNLSLELLKLLVDNPKPELKPSDPAVPREAQGLVHKYHITRVDQSEQHPDCEYFVMDLTHDPYSVPAMVIYALAAGVEYPQLKDDILARYNAALPPIRPTALEWVIELMEPYRQYKQGLQAGQNFFNNYCLKPKGQA